MILMVIGMMRVEAQEEIRFMSSSLKTALSIAKQRGKNLFVDTYADWCIPCKRMEKIFKDPDVARFYNEHFVNLRINMQNSVKAAEIRKKYDVVFLPTMFILDGDGIIKYQVDHELSRDEMLNIGQMMLDPANYNISDATTIRRNDGTVMATRPSNINQPPIRAVEKKKSPASKIDRNSESTGNAVVHNPAPGNKKKLIKPNQSADSTSLKDTGLPQQDSTNPDQYETISESKEKVLMVLDANATPPPEVLRQEAYHRMEKMDGSYRQAAVDYLSTQKDWNTPTNRKFILDFVYTTQSKMFDFLISHKDEFLGQFGEERILKTIEVLVYRALFNRVPRPTYEESVTLYENLYSDDGKKRADLYFINRLKTEGSMQDHMDIVKKIVEGNKSADLYYEVALYLLDHKTQLGYAAKLMEKVIKTEKKGKYFEILADIYRSMGKKKKAKKVMRKWDKVRE